MNKLIYALVLILAVPSMGAVSRVKIRSNENPNDFIEKVTVTWTGNGTNGAVTNQSLSLFGTILKVETQPGLSAYGGSAPTDNYDIALLSDDNDLTYDTLNGELANRDFRLSEAKYPLTTTTNQKLVAAGLYDLAISNNSSLSGNGSVIFWLAPKGL